jgi:hypothetical protein
MDAVPKRLLHGFFFFLVKGALELFLSIEGVVKFIGMDRKKRMIDAVIAAITDNTEAR